MVLILSLHSSWSDVECTEAAVIHKYVRAGFFQMEHSGRGGATLLHTHRMKQDNVILLVPGGMEEGGGANDYVTAIIS